MDNLAPYDFFFELPLYTKIEVPFTNTTPLRNLLNFRGTIDAYNSELKENTTYRITNNSYGSSNQVSVYNGYTSYTATCVRNDYAIRFFIFLNQTENGDWVIQKVGQHPSIADLHISRVRAYDKVLYKQKLQSLQKQLV